ncbi:hypothetical protein [Bacillus cereus]
MQGTGPENLVIIMYANELKRLIEIKPNSYCSKKLGFLQAGYIAWGIR